MTTGGRKATDESGKGIEQRNSDFILRKASTSIHLEGPFRMLEGLTPKADKKSIFYTNEHQLSCDRPNRELCRSDSFAEIKDQGILTNNLISVLQLILHRDQ